MASMAGERPLRGDARTVWIGGVWPELDSGRYPVKRVVGDVLEVSADVFLEGHGSLAAVVCYRTIKDTSWREATMAHAGNDRWTARIALEENTRYRYTVEAWADPWGSWAVDLRKRLAAGLDVQSELREGAALVRATRDRAGGANRERLQRLLDDIDRDPDPASQTRALLAEETAALMALHADRSAATRYDRELEVVVDRRAARFAAWYELFPRSQGTEAGVHGTFRDCIRRLPDIAAMGFDVIYLPPIHPIGRTARKGRQNALEAGPDDPGSPWAIGNEHGGHKAIEPALGTPADFRALVAAARDHGIEIALDYALQCSPDHPWVREHPEWFHRRPDGTIKYAENPPKKYQDIYPINFACRDREALWEELRSVVLHWIGEGVRTFRVDNPHTKPIPFWAWLIREVQAVYPDVVFLSEAFTRPRLMQALGKVGFTQSYTYFTWRNFKDEIREYFTELTRSEMAEYFRGNLFCNTPDILPPVLQQGGRAAFKMRAALAATLSPVWGVYSGYELCEHAAIPGREEYLDSEKYEVRVRDWDAPGNIKPYLGRLNRLRREHPALQEYTALTFYEADGEHVLFYGKRSPDGADVVWVAVNLDPYDAHEATLRLPLADVGLAADDRVQVHDLLTDRRQLWRGPEQRIRLDPADEPAAVFHVTPLPRKPFDEPCA